MNLLEAKSIKMPKFEKTEETEQFLNALINDPIREHANSFMRKREEVIIKYAKEEMYKYLFVGIECEGVGKKENAYSLNMKLVYVPSDSIYPIPDFEGYWIDLDEAREIIFNV